jgi:hypothetical protein
MYMSNDHVPPEHHGQEAGGVREKTEGSRQDADQDRGPK